MPFGDLQTLWLSKCKPELWVGEPTSHSVIDQRTGITGLVEPCEGVAPLVIGFGSAFGLKAL